MPTPNAATLNVQPRQRRSIYEWLADTPDGRSVKALLGELSIPEPELRETLRKLEAAGLAKRVKGTWIAVPLEDAEPRVSETPEPQDAPPAS
jgi:DNA-binding transcriptional ArsR family regulator